SPVTLVVRNRDWENWKDKMSPAASARDEKIRVTQSRPGHADLAGVMKYRQRDVRNILERSSARETAARVAVGAVAKALLSEFGIDVLGYVSSIGSIKAESQDISKVNLRDLVINPDFYTFDHAAEARMKILVDRARESGDSVGGVIEVAVIGAPVGLGSHVHWDRKLDARIAMAVMSVQAIKGVEIGMGFESAARPGSMVHDEIYFDSSRISWGELTGYYRKTNNAGGLEGGITNGEPIIVRAAMKPIPTLYKPLMSVDLSSREPIEATVERSDVCAVPAATVVIESVVAIEVLNAFLEKFGGDSVEEIRSNYDGYLEVLKAL
ncbi:MAG TPA: chorismate synthase, partial [Geobacteraceae bacterium]|nr:chorismate synthase [Geobacteraceae bacterium]